MSGDTGDKPSPADLAEAERFDRVRWNAEVLRLQAVERAAAELRENLDELLKQNLPGRIWDEKVRALLTAADHTERGT
jgi:hypothetical protein